MNQSYVRGFFGFVCLLLPSVSNTVSYAEKGQNELLGLVVKDVQERGEHFQILMRSHKTFCWDGTDPDKSTSKEYEGIIAGLALLESHNKLIATAAQSFPSLDSYIEYRLTIANAALKSNCLNIADEQYRTVLREFPYPIYSRYRDLAKIGVDDVREKRGAQAAVNQKHASPSSVPWELVGEWLPRTDGDNGLSFFKDVGKCKPTSPSESGPFTLKPDGSWSKLFPNDASSSCNLSVVPFSGDRKDWKVTSTCQPQITQLWSQLGSARDRITVHNLIDNPANGGNKSIGAPVAEYRRCD